MSRALEGGLAVICVSHGHETEVPRLLEDLERVEGSSIDQVVVVDNLGTGSLETTVGGSSRVTVLTRDRRAGFGANVNAGVRQVLDDVDWLAFINPDVRLESPILKHLVKGLEGDARPGIVAPALVHPGTRLSDVNARPFPTPKRLLRRIWQRVGRPPPAVPPASLTLEPADWISGAFMVLSRDWFHRLGGFDETFFMYGEDVDLCLRSWRAGRGVFVDPRCVGFHEGARANGRSPRHFMWFVTAVLRLYRRYGVSPDVRGGPVLGRGRGGERGDATAERRGNVSN